MKQKRTIISLLWLLIFTGCVDGQKNDMHNPQHFYFEYFRTFSFHAQKFEQPLNNPFLRKFCYKVYYHKSSSKKYAFEFINENGNSEYIGYFNPMGLLEKTEVIDYSRGRMNMKYYYTPGKKLIAVRLFDDQKIFFAYGKAQYSPDNNVIFIDFISKETGKTLLYQMIRSDGKGNDVEIATYSNEGTLFSNHLYFYSRSGNLVKYEFYKKLKFIAGFKFTPSGILELRGPSGGRNLSNYNDAN